MAKKKILVVDDEPALVKALTIRLKLKGYKVIPAYDGEEGLKKAEEENPDLILLDIMMPKLDGFATLIELKKRSKNRNIPLPAIIILTAKQKMKTLFAAEGIKDYVVKPFEHKELLWKVEKLLKGKGKTKDG